jgi:Insulinase (Peptidase family M16)
MRRCSGVLVTAFATFSSTTTKRSAIVPTASSHFSRATVTSSSALSKRPTFVSIAAQQRRHQSTSTLLQVASTTMEKSTTGSSTGGSSRLDLQAKMDVTHPSYEVLQKDIVTEYGAYCTLYRHTKSGAELLSVAVDDDNKVFGITLRTPPEDSTGVPHILEHSVLCGSRKYTTKDPFVHLLKGSLQTFLNAFTYPDRTCYVVASQNEKDFYNLVNVYADAVYHPRAVSDPMVHAQEGWHLEVNDDNKLIYNGVV